MIIPHRFNKLLVYSSVMVVQLVASLMHKLEGVTTTLAGKKKKAFRANYNSAIFYFIFIWKGPDQIWKWLSRELATVLTVSD